MVDGREVLLEPKRDALVGPDFRAGVDFATEDGREGLGLCELADELDLFDESETIYL